MIRQHQTAATREQILETAMDMLSQGPEEPFSHEAIARKADMGARTVYRYFPHRADLLQALWERLRETTQTRFPGSESEVALLIGEQFRHFDEHAALVRASLATSATAEVRGVSPEFGEHSQGSAGGGAEAGGGGVSGDLQRLFLAASARPRRAIRPGGAGSGNVGYSDSLECGEIRSET
jgi:AcrR family transcriptional regulator